MKIDWDVDLIKQELNKISYAEDDRWESGFNTVKCKKDLYSILWYVEDLLEKCSTYTGEEEWINDRDKQKTWKALGGKS